MAPPSKKKPNLEEEEEDNTDDVNHNLCDYEQDITEEVVHNDNTATNEITSSSAFKTLLKDFSQTISPRTNSSSQNQRQSSNNNIKLGSKNTTRMASLATPKSSASLSPKSSTNTKNINSNQHQQRQSMLEMSRRFIHCSKKHAVLTAKLAFQSISEQERLLTNSQLSRTSSEGMFVMASSLNRKKKIRLQTTADHGGVVPCVRNNNVIVQAQNILSYVDPNESNDDEPSSYCTAKKTIKELFGPKQWSNRMKLLMKVIIVNSPTWQVVSQWRKKLRSRSKSSYTRDAMRNNTMDFNKIMNIPYFYDNVNKVFRSEWFWLPEKQERPNQQFFEDHSQTFKDDELVFQFPYKSIGSRLREDFKPVHQTNHIKEDRWEGDTERSITCQIKHGPKKTKAEIDKKYWNNNTPISLVRSHWIEQHVANCNCPKCKTIITEDVNDNIGSAFNDVASFESKATSERKRLRGRFAGLSYEQVKSCVLMTTNKHSKKRY